MNHHGKIRPRRARLETGIALMNAIAFDAPRNAP
jgi:hypothetical protein